MTYQEYLAEVLWQLQMNRIMPQYQSPAHDVRRNADPYNHPIVFTNNTMHSGKIRHLTWTFPKRYLRCPSTAQYSQVQPSTAQYSQVQPSTAQYQPSTAQYSPVQPSTS